MDVITKAIATVTPVDETSDPDGEFDVILSTPTKDRDGENVLASEWKTPLPEHITFDSDHDMKVNATVGSGKPFINADGNIQVRGTYASTDHAQNVRKLVPKHIRHVSVEMLVRKDENGNLVRELLGGSFVKVPANVEAVVLSSKAAGGANLIEGKDVAPDGASDAGAEQTGVEAVLRNALTSLKTAVQLHNGQGVPDALDADDGTYPHLQMIHDAAVQLGGKCATSMAPPEAEDGQVWGANSPTITAPQTSGKSAGAADAAAHEAAADAAPTDDAEVLAKAKRLAVTLSALD